MQGASAAGNGWVQNRGGNANHGHENGMVLDEEQLLFLTGGQDTAVDDDVDEPTVQDLALNVDNIFQADECDMFDSDVDDDLTVQTMFMVNISSAEPIYDEAGPSHDLDILFEVHDHDNYQDAICEHHEIHEMHDDVQQNCVVDLHDDYTSDRNMISYDQLPNVSMNNQNKIVNASLTVELARYKEQVELYERRAKFDLNEREQKIKEQLKIIISDQDRLFKQDQSLQTRSHYDEQKKAAIGYENPLYLTRAMQVHPALYNGHEITKTDHLPAIVHNSEDTLEIA
ncbi:hypothetical protein Tco_1383388 [Tanacetum coccineum]